MSDVKLKSNHVIILVLSSRTDFFVDMSGQVSSRRLQLSTKQWSGNRCSDDPTKIQTLSYVMGKQWRAEHQARRCTRLTSRNSRAFLKAYFIYILFICMYPFFFKIVHYYVDKIESLSICRIFSKLLCCRQFC